VDICPNPKAIKTRVLPFPFTFLSLPKTFTVSSLLSQKKPPLPNFKNLSFYLEISHYPFVSIIRLIMTNPEGSSSQIPTRDEPINFSGEIPVGSLQFMEEPDVKEAEEKIWKSQVIIPCPNSPHAFLGPLPDKENREKLISIFPSSEK